jgi:hypothetical protein
VLVDHLDTLDDAATKSGNVDSRTINRFLNEIKTEFGATGKTDLGAVAQVVAGEIQKATGGSVSVTETENVLRGISTANTVGQLHSASNRFRQLARGQLRGLRQQFVSAISESGTPEADATAEFDRKLYPATRKALEGEDAGPSQRPIIVGPKGERMTLSPDGKSWVPVGG